MNMDFLKSTSYTQQDLLTALAGGAIIGLATTINYMCYGRITGNSGMFNSLIKLDGANGLKWKF